MALLETAGLHAAYGQTRVLHGIGFSMEEGTITTLLGANGAGKTTTLRMLATILKPSGGTAKVAGHDVNTDAEKVRARLKAMETGRPVQRFTVERMVPAYSEKFLERKPERLKNASSIE